MPHNPRMPANIEIKARIASVDALLPLAVSLSEDRSAQRIVQDDSFFRVASGRLKLRVFGDGSGELIHYLRADAEGPKQSDYLIAAVPEPDTLRELLARANGLLGRVRKERLLVLVGHSRIHLDQVEGLGDFLEIEVMLQPGQSAADGEAIAQGLMHSLGVLPQQLVSGAYIDLIAAAAAAAPPPAA